MENKPTANKWLIATVIVMGLVIIGLVAWIIVGALNNDKSVESSKNNETKKDSSRLSDKAREEEVNPSSETKKKYKDFRTGGDGRGTQLTSVSDVDKLDIDDSLKEFLKSKVGQPIPEREGYTYKPVIDRAYGKYAAVYGLTNAYTIIGPKKGTGEIGIVAGTQQSYIPCSDLKAASVPSRLVDGKCEISGTPQAYEQD